MTWPALAYRNKFTFLVVCVVISALIIDTSIIKVYYLNVSISSYHWSVIVFIIISIISIAGQHLLLAYAKKKNAEIRASKTLHLQGLHIAVALIQYGLGTIIIIVSTQMLTLSRYNVAALILASWISYGLSAALMGLLAHRLFSWFISNRNYVVLSYCFSCVFIGLNAVFTILYVTYYLLNQPAIAMPHPGFNTPFVVATPLTITLSFGYSVSSIASFTASWVATAILLHQHSRKLGTVRYWLIVCIPLVYFLMQFQPLILNLFLTFSQSEPLIFSILYTLVFTMSNPTGGILFGIAFWVIARKLPHGIVTREYLIISAIGFVLLFVSNQGIDLVSAPYPPFGLPTISFVGLASYLILTGIYSSAISVAENSKLRRSIRSLAITESRLLDSIGSAHMEREIESKVLQVVKAQQETLAEQNAIQPSLTEDDAKEYLAEVINEIKKQKDQPHNNKNHNNE